MEQEKIQCSDIDSKITFTPSYHFYEYGKIKRALDISAALGLLFVAFVPCCAIVAAIKINDRGPAIFRQKRIGRYGKEFYCLKFRTMKTTAPMYRATSELKNADEYITSVGKVLRETSLDELPQLINILKGDMSFIGPRPLIPEEKSIHDERLKKGIYNLRPGISGLAQINGRDKLDGQKKVRYDEDYLKNISLALDIKIFVKTIFGVIKRSDIIDGNETTGTK